MPEVQPPLFDELAAPLPVAAAELSADPVHVIGAARLYLGDCVEVLRLLPADCLDGAVTDPPYGIGFMGKEWDTFDPDDVADNARKAFRMDHGRNIDEATADDDTPANIRGRQRSPAMSPSQIDYDRTIEGQRGFQAWCETWGRELLRVLKPGAHIVVCGAPRSAHRMVSGLEDAGFEIRDGLAWLFGQGFPKSMDAERALAQHACQEPGRHFPRKLPRASRRRPGDHVCARTAASAALTGWGTALKPGHEPICLARKPFPGTLGENLARYGVGALAIERCRIELPEDDPNNGAASELGRWPPNVAMDAEAAALLDAQAGIRRSGPNPKKRKADKFQRIFNRYEGETTIDPARGSQAAAASRFFFVPKPSRAERDFGCEALPMRTAGELTEREDGSDGLTPYAGAGRSGGGRNFHPTVKPVALMRWLLALTVPPGGCVIDPFFGSGTTALAALLEGYEFIGIERDPEYLALGSERVRGIMAAIARQASSAAAAAAQE